MPQVTFTCEACICPCTRYTNPHLPPPRFCSKTCLHTYARNHGLGNAKKRYVFTPAMDLAIRRSFWGRRGGLATLKRTDPAFRTIPYYMVKSRAKDLGLVRTMTDQVWTPEETAFCLERWEVGTKPDALVMAMRRRGWHRSKTAIVAMMEKHKQSRHGGSLTLPGVAQALGIDDHVVRRWAAKGWLPTHTHVSDRVQLVSPAHLRRFVIEHPWEVAKGAPDTVWLISLLCDPDVMAKTPRAVHRRKQEA